MQLIVTPPRAGSAPEDRRRFCSWGAGNSLQLETTRRASGCENRLDEVGLLSGHDGASKPGDACRLVGKLAARNADPEVGVEHAPFHPTLLAIQLS
jgi:hypothetical protein